MNKAWSLVGFDGMPNANYTAHTRSEVINSVVKVWVGINPDDTHARAKAWQNLKLKYGLSVKRVKIEVME